MSKFKLKVASLFLSVGFAFSLFPASVSLADTTAERGGPDDEAGLIVASVVGRRDIMTKTVDADVSDFDSSAIQDLEDKVGNVNGSIRILNTKITGRHYIEDGGDVIEDVDAATLANELGGTFELSYNLEDVGYFDVGGFIYDVYYFSDGEWYEADWRADNRRVDDAKVYITTANDGYFAFVYVEPEAEHISTSVYEEDNIIIDTYEYGINDLRTDLKEKLLEIVDSDDYVRIFSVNIEVRYYVENGEVVYEEVDPDKLAQDNGGVFHYAFTFDDVRAVYKVYKYSDNDWVEVTDWHIVGDQIIVQADEKRYGAFTFVLNEEKKCGDSMIWSFDDTTGTLTISGSGAMNFYYNEDDRKATSDKALAPAMAPDPDSKNNNVVNDAPWIDYIDDIKSVVFDGEITSISNAAFAGCENLTNVDLPDSLDIIGPYAFKDCSSLKSITLPDNVTRIGAEAFAGCKNLTNIKLSASLYRFGTYLFLDCESLTDITIPSGVYTITAGTFANCKSLKNISIPESVTRIDEYAFWNCTSLTSITLPENLQSISTYAFRSCTGLTAIRIPQSVTSIGYYAFAYCTSLRYINFDGTREQFNEVLTCGGCDSTKIYDDTVNVTVYCTDDAKPTGSTPAPSNPTTAPGRTTTTTPGRTTTTNPGRTTTTNPGRTTTTNPGRTTTTNPGRTTTTNPGRTTTTNPGRTTTTNPGRTTTTNPGRTTTTNPGRTTTTNPGRTTTTNPGRSTTTNPGRSTTTNPGRSTTTNPGRTTTTTRTVSTPSRSSAQPPYKPTEGAGLPLEDGIMYSWDYFS